MQAAYLLGRTELDDVFLRKCRQMFARETNPKVQQALAGLLMQLTGRGQAKFLHSIVFHPNEEIRKLGILFREMKFDPEYSVKKLKFAMDPRYSWRVVDFMPFLFVARESDRTPILRAVTNMAAVLKSKTNLLDMVPLFDKLSTEVARKIA